MNRITILGFVFLAGCAVRAGNPGDDRRKVMITGVIAGLEDNRGLQVEIRAMDSARNEIAKAQSSIYGTYELKNIPSGTIILAAGSQYERMVTLPADASLVVIDIVVPVPAAPVRLRSVRMGPQVFCLLWDDLSGFETEYQLGGPMPITAPSNTSGVIVYLPNVITDDMGAYDWPAMNRRWSQRFAGTYFLSARNEYGNSVSVATHVDAYPLDSETVFEASEGEVAECGGIYVPPNFREEIVFIKENP